MTKMASKKIFIVGGDGFARECYNNLINLDEYGKEVIFGGFLGHNGYGKSVDYKTYQHLYLGEVAEHRFKDDEYCIIGAGYPEIRKMIYDDLKNMGVNSIRLFAMESIYRLHLSMAKQIYLFIRFYHL